MMLRALLLWTLGAGLPALLPADFSYRQTTTISGAAAGGMAGRAGQIAAAGPIASTIAVKDGRLLARFADRATVIDPGQQTVTEIDFSRRTYSVASFDEIRRAEGDRAPLRPSVKATGNTRTIGGLEAGEMAMKLEAPSPETGAVAGAVWLAQPAAGYAEMRDVVRRMDAAVDWSPWGRLFADRPEIARILAALFRASAMAEGMPVLEVTAIDLPAEAAHAPAARLGGRNPLGQWGSGFGANGEPLFDIRTEIGGFSSAALDEADFAVPPSFRRVPAEILQPAKK